MTDAFEIKKLFYAAYICQIWEIRGNCPHVFYYTYWVQVTEGETQTLNFSKGHPLLLFLKFSEFMD